MGYARGHCPRYSCDGAGDAVRFLISNDQAGLVRIEYVVERDHHPHHTIGPRLYSILPRETRSSIGKPSPSSPATCAGRPWLERFHAR